MHHARAITALRASKRCRALNHAILETLENRRLLSVSIISSLFNEANGANPASGVTMDAQGNLFGTTSNNGANGDGTVFEIVHGTTTITTLASFNGTNGKSPRGQVAVDSDGNVYGDTLLGGANQRGTVWELVKGSHNITLLASFDGTNTGSDAFGGVTLGANNTLYGTASAGGANGAGTIFSYVQSTHTLSAMVSLNSLYIDGMPVQDASNDIGGTPFSSLFMDASGNFFGTASVGGTTTDGSVDLDQGTVFEISNTGGFSVLAPFSGGPGSAQFPGTAPVVDSSGNIYGVTYNGGTNHLGTLYQVQNHTINVLFSFDATNQHPTDLIIDSNGNLFGTTDGNGLNNGTDGTIFEFTHASLANGTPTLTTIASFNGTNGLDPEGNLVMDANGNFYGTCLGGGNSNSEGTFYKVTTLGAATHLAFTATPTTATTGSALSPAVTVAVEDANNNIVTTDSSNITLTLSNGSGTLGGTVKVAAINGVATFNNLTISAAGAADTLSATDGVLIAATSSNITVTGAGGVTGLAPAIVSSSVPANIITGQTLKGASLKITLTNPSASPEKDFTLKVYASADSTLDTNSDTLITTLPEPKATVNGNKTSPFTIPISSFPSALANGSYFLIVETIDSANNTLSVATANEVTVVAPFVSLSETITTTLPSTLVSGTSTKGAVTLLITNNGNVPSTGSTGINITASTTSGTLGTSIYNLPQKLTVTPGKPLKVTIQIKSLPSLVTNNYFLVAQITDAFASGTSLTSTANTLSIAAPVITLSATLAPLTKITSADTITLNNTGNIEDSSPLTITYGFSFDALGAQPIGLSNTTIVKAVNILPGKNIKIQSKEWSKILAGLHTAVPYFLTVNITDSDGHTTFAVSPNSFTL